MRRILPLLLVLLAAQQASAQDYWRAANGPYGGTIVSDLEVAPEGLYAASVGGLFKSTDNGLTWALDMDGVTASGVDARALLRTSDGVTLLATYGGGIFKRWSGTTDWQGANSPDAWVQALAEGDDGTLYAGTIRGILRAEAGTDTWMALPIDERTLNVRSVAAEGNVVYAATSEGVYKSEDRGVTWDWASTGMTTWDTDMLFLTSTGDLYAGTSPITGGCTLFRTRSKGRFWTCVQPQADPVRAGAMAEDLQGRLYFGGYRFVYRSDDEGSTWKSVAATSTTVHSLAANGSTVLAGTYGRGVLRSGDRGGTWESANAGLHSAIRDVIVGPDGAVFAATLGGVFHSTDRGSSWKLLDNEDAPVQPAQTLALDDDGKLLDGTLNGLFRYDLDNNTWEALGPPGTPPIRDIKFGSDGDLYVGYWEGVYHLRGSGWVSYPLIGPDQAARDVIAVGLDGSGTLFAGGTYDSFMRPAGAAGWIRLTSSATPYFEAQVFESDATGALYAGTRYFGVMRSTDGGQSWSPMTEGLSGSEDIRSIAFDPEGVMYAGSFGNGIYRLNPATRAWQPQDSGMEDARRVTSLVFDIDGNAYAGTYGAGIFVHEAGGSTAVETQAPGVSSPSLTAFPNPTRGQTFAQGAFPEATTASVAVFDILGRQVRSASVHLNAGLNRRIPLPTEGLATGLYSVRITGSGVATATTLAVLR